MFGLRKVGGPLINPSPGGRGGCLMWIVILVAAFVAAKWFGII